MAVLVEQFKEGDAVPTWLFNAEAKAPSVVITELVFVADCALIETADAYYLINEREAHRGVPWEVGYTGPEAKAVHFHFRAATKPVWFPPGCFGVG